MEIYKSRISILEEQLKNEVISPIQSSEYNKNQMNSPVPDVKEEDSSSSNSNESSEVISIQEDIEEKEVVPEGDVEITPKETNEEDQTTNQIILTSTTSIGPPQPELPPSAEIDELSVETLLQQKEELEKEIQETTEAIHSLQKELEESKQINLFVVYYLNFIS